MPTAIPVGMPGIVIKVQVTAGEHPLWGIVVGAESETLQFGLKVVKFIWQSFCGVFAGQIVHCRQGLPGGKGRLGLCRQASGDIYREF
ncbi:hypothetical protein [Kamptonema formosum]|uniref:hypothetical protein n=1 Tax=Kamptonema formosum TaxID=331992 RepID=UPI0012DFE68B